MSAETVAVAIVDQDDPRALALEAQMQAEYVQMYGTPDLDPDNHISSTEGVILMTIEGRDVGIIGWKHWPDGDGKVCLVYVHPTWRGRHLAEALLRTVEEILGDEGVTRMRFETGPKQVAAMRLYERAGYRVTDERFGFYADRDDAGVFLTKDLTR